MFLKPRQKQKTSNYSNRKDIHQQIPSFDNLQSRIRDFSYSRLSNVTQQIKNETTYSPYKAQGLQQKITHTLGPRTKSFNSGHKWRESFQSPSISTQSPLKFVVQSPPPQLKYSMESESYINDSFKYDSFRTSSEQQFKRKQGGGRNLADIVQLNEIVALRNKIESSQIRRSTLTSTYVSELVKLAQAITTSLKNE